MMQNAGIGIKRCVHSVHVYMCVCTHVYIIQPIMLVHADIVLWPSALCAMSNTQMPCPACDLLLSARRQSGGGLQAERKRTKIGLINRNCKNHWQCAKITKNGTELEQTQDKERIISEET